MPALGERKFYDFRMQSLTEVQAALGRLMKERARLSVLGIPVIEKMYKYIEPLQKTALLKDTKDAPLMIVDQFILTYLDAELIDAFIANPSDQEYRDALSIQLGYVSAATNNTPNLQSYTDEELLEVLRGGEVYYNEILFVHTLREIISGTPSAKILSPLLSSLPTIREREDVDGTYFWDDAFVLGMLLHVLWKHVEALSSQEQTVLFQNYLYRAIVAGVPVRVWLSEAAEQKPEDMAVWSQMLARSREHIPTDTRVENGENFSDMQKRFMAAVLSEEISTLAQEKFLKNMYANQPNREVFVIWLRETLSLVYHIKSEDLMEFSYE